MDGTLNPSARGNQRANVNISSISYLLIETNHLFFFRSEFTHKEAQRCVWHGILSIVEQKMHAVSGKFRLFTCLRKGNKDETSNHAIIPLSLLPLFPLKFRSPSRAEIRAVCFILRVLSLYFPCTCTSSSSPTPLSVYFTAIYLSKPPNPPPSLLLPKHSCLLQKNPSMYCIVLYFVYQCKPSMVIHTFDYKNLREKKRKKTRKKLFFFFFFFLMYM